MLPVTSSVSLNQDDLLDQPLPEQLPPVQLVAQPVSHNLLAIDDVVQPVSKDTLNQLTQLLADMGQDRQDLLDYIKKLEDNQELLLSELNLQKKEDLVKQQEVALMTKRMADLTYANNLYHISLVEQSCTLPEALLYETPQPSQPPNPPQDTQTPLLQSPCAKKVTIQSPSAKKDATKPLKKALTWINRISKVLSKLEKKYAIPVEKRKPAMFTRKPRSVKHIVPKVFRTMFQHLAAPPPEPVTVPDPCPTVDWSSVRFKPALPNPEDCPVYSASKDPADYKMQPSKSGFPGDRAYSTFTLNSPFGTLPGYRTTMGVVSVPATPVQGYIYCPDARRWLLHASLNTGGRQPAGRRYPGTSRGERERRKSHAT